MGLKRICFQTLTGLLLVSSTSLLAQQAPQFLVSQEDVEDLSVTQLKNRYSFGLNVYSVIPSARPFQAVSGAQVQDFRYQVSGAVGLEFFYKSTPRFEWGLSGSYEFFESRLKADAGSVEFRTAKMRMIPLNIMARYQWPKVFWAPSVEAGLGMGLGSTTLESTNLAQNTIKDSNNSLLAHVAGGASFAWLDDTDLGILVGYRMAFSGTKIFDATTFEIHRKNLSGIYAKATLRHHF